MANVIPPVCIGSVDQSASLYAHNPVVNDCVITEADPVAVQTASGAENPLFHTSSSYPSLTQANIRALNKGLVAQASVISNMSEATVVPENYGLPGDKGGTSFMTQATEHDEPSDAPNLPNLVGFSGVMSMLGSDLVAVPWNDLEDMWRSGMVGRECASELISKRAGSTNQLPAQSSTALSTITLGDKTIVEDPAPTAKLHNDMKMLLERGGFEGRVDFLFHTMRHPQGTLLHEVIQDVSAAHSCLDRSFVDGVIRHTVDLDGLYESMQRLLGRRTYTAWDIVAPLMRYFEILQDYVFVTRDYQWRPDASATRESAQTIATLSFLFRVQIVRNLQDCMDLESKEVVIARSKAYHELRLQEMRENNYLGWWREEFDEVE